jgi:hypothetical protein
VKLFSCFIIIAAFAFAQPPDPDDAGKKKIIDDARAKGLAYAKELPEYVCTQLTRQNLDPKGTNQWKKLDTINEQLTFVNHTEDYRLVAVNGKPQGEGRHASDSITAAEFTRLLAITMDPKSQAEIAWSQWDTLRGHRVHSLGYRVAKEHSQLTIGKKGQQITVGYFGVINVDSESGSILKIGMVALDIPAKFPIHAYSEELNYEFAKIGDHYYVLPLKADIHTKEGKIGSLTWNEVEYSNYRKPGAETASVK